MGTKQSKGFLLGKPILTAVRTSGNILPWPYIARQNEDFVHVTSTRILPNDAFAKSIRSLLCRFGSDWFFPNLASKSSVSLSMGPCHP